MKELYIEPMGISITQLALALDVSRKAISTIVNGRKAVTPEMALRLSQALDTTPELWLNLQKTYDLWHAAHQTSAWQQVQSFLAA